MLGPSLLVAPVFVDVKEESEYYIPAGRWTSFFHPERTVQGPVWIKEVVRRFILSPVAVSSRKPGPSG